MKFYSKIASLAALLTTFFATSATAAIISPVGPGSAEIDFIALTEESAANGGLGESAWSVLSVPTFFGMQITGHSSVDDNHDDGSVDTDQFAYLDWNAAGLGVCKDASSVNQAFPGSGTNHCDPGSDDNVTENEYLEIMFGQDVVVDEILFNNNHDGGLHTGESVWVDDTLFVFALGTNLDKEGKGGVGIVDGVGGNGFALSAGEKLKIAFSDEQFYVQGMTVSAVPVPAAFWLFGTALAGFVGISRRRKLS